MSNQLQKNSIEEVANVAEDVIEIVDDVVDKVSPKSKVLSIALAPFKITAKVVIGIGKFGIRRLKIFGSKFRRFTNYATDDEKGPVIRFTAWLFLRVGAVFGLVGGLILQHYVDVVEFVINLFS